MKPIFLFCILLISCDTVHQKIIGDHLITYSKGGYFDTDTLKQNIDSVKFDEYCQAKIWEMK
jgi:hypothetical protein